ncbi:N2227-like protein-domain-containing protein [Flammula alnicola]|nr:N2227-like protein-domain-containing protein [Flammula alnicola]
MSFSDLRFIVASDVLLACVFPLFLLFVGFKHLPTFTCSDIREILSLGSRKRRHNGYFSLERAYSSFSQYARLSADELHKMRASYATLRRSNKNLGYKIGYPKKLDRLRDVTSLNATIADGIAELALDEFPSLENENDIDTNSTDLGRVRESLKHFVRDWSEEGLAERTRMKVLVPGCGLGRLAWEIAQLGFDTTANELSFFMTLAFRFLLSSTTTTSANEHSLRPYAHWFSHQRSNDSLFRCISFPDVVPRLSPNFRLLEQDFLETSGYDYIVTLFFIDTSLDVFMTMKHIYSILRPGGTWAKVELSLEEVLQAAEEIGFVIETDESCGASRKTVECEYTGDPDAMMRWIYKAEFWVAKKLK